MHYHEASRMLLDDFDELVCAEGGEEPVRALLIACQLNAAQCALKREEWFAADKVGAGATHPRCARLL